MKPNPFLEPHPYPIFRTILVITIRDGSTNKELFSEIEGVVVTDRARGLSTQGIIMQPDLPRAKKYWKASFIDVVPRIRLQVFGGPTYEDITMDITINNKRRFMNVLVVMQRRRT